MKRELLRFQDVSKSHRTQEVFRSLSFDVFAGETVGMLIPPLSGKTTMTRILRGEEDYAGEIYFCGRPVKKNLKAMNASGEILCLSRQSPLIPALSIGENMFLAAGRRPWRFIDGQKDNEAAQAYLDELNLNISADEPVRAADIYTRHMAQIAAAMRSGARLLVYDDPSAYYDKEQLRSLKDVLRRLRERGVAVLYLASASFPMELSMFDRLVVIRDYRKVRTIFHPDDSLLASMDRTPSVPESAAAAAQKPPERSPGVTPALSLRGVRSEGLPEINLVVEKGCAVGVSARRIATLQHFAALFSPHSEYAQPVYGSFSVDGKIRRGSELFGDFGVKYVVLDDTFAHDQLLTGQSILDNVYLPVSRSRRMGMLSFNNGFRRSLQQEIEARLGISPERQALPASVLDTNEAQELVLFRLELQNPAFVVYATSYTQIDRRLQELLLQYFRRYLRAGTGLLIAAPNLELFSPLISSSCDLDAAG